jgi:hypothetical protein
MKPQRHPHNDMATHCGASLPTPNCAIAQRRCCRGNPVHGRRHVLFFFKYYDGPIIPLCSTYQSNHAPSSRPNRQTTSTLFVGLLLYPSRVYCFSGVVLTQCCLSSLPPLPLSSTTVPLPCPLKKIAKTPTCGTWTTII